MPGRDPRRTAWDETKGSSPDGSKKVKASQKEDPRKADSAKAGKLKRKDYEKEAERSCTSSSSSCRNGCKHKGLKVCIVFEGRDGAGKGGTIKAITERVSPRVFRVVALPAPTEREKSQMYMQRYLPHLPAAGEIVIFDRSWYNRAGVERVMGFCTEEQVESFLKAVPLVEKAIVDSGVILLKYWLEVSPEEQTRRLEGAHRRRPQDLEALADGPEVVQPLVRLLAGARRHVRGHRHGVGAVVRRALRRQEAGAPEHHHAPAPPDPVQVAAAREGQAAEAERSKYREQPTRSRSCPRRREDGVEWPTR